MVVQSGNTKLHRCSFCLQSEPEVQWLVEGQGVEGHEVFICDECARLCLDAAEGNRGPFDATAHIRRRLWFTCEGETHEVANHANFARDRLKLDKDSSMVAIRAGWIAASESAGRLRIRYADNAPISNAVDRLIHWLLDQSRRGQQITRSVFVERRWIDVDHPTISSIIQSLSDAAAVASVGPRPTQPRVVRREPITGLTQSLGVVLAALQQTDGSAEALIQFTFNWRARDHIGLHRVEGEEVRLAFSGDALIGRRACALGRDIRERADLPYAMAVREELMVAVTEQQAAHYDRRVPINGVWHHYHNLKYSSRPDAAGIYFVLTASEILARGSA